MVYKSYCVTRRKYVIYAPAICEPNRNKVCNKITYWPYVLIIFYMVIKILVFFFFCCFVLHDSSVMKMITSYNLQGREACMFRTGTMVTTYRSAYHATIQPLDFYIINIDSWKSRFFALIVRAIYLKNYCKSHNL